MNKLLVIAGPTASGKTALAAKIARRRSGELVSADSRQVYKYMDIGTGKDLPVNSKFKILNSKIGGFYLINKVRLWGYDLVNPTDEFSVAQYVPIAWAIIEDIWERGQLPILVGGTGLYINGVLDSIDTLGIPRDHKLRGSLKNKDAGELFELLRVEDPVRAANLNVSDRRNPRRLVRAIEVARNKDLGIKKQDLRIKNFSMIGIKKEKAEFDRRIEERVRKRLKMGFEEEVEKLLNMGVTWEHQSMQALGYRQWGQYVRGEITRKQATENWIREEQKYAKRQMVWFRKDKRIKRWYS